MTSDSYNNPLPIPDADTAPFWEACQRHSLIAQQCLDCQEFRWPPQDFCPGCLSRRFEWCALSEHGVVIAHVTVERFGRSFSAEVPFVIAHVAIDQTDGKVVLIGNLMGCPPEEVRVGLAVDVVFDDVTPMVTLPKFRRSEIDRK